ncbi:MAG TPA: SDR family oxidoreductase [Acidimicrobiia bacterium]|nr:SDR family oxidoreductase [Acidimicrobiia bacterium]
MDVVGRSVVVTGGGSGIGRALARRMAADGAQVAVGDHDADGARSTVRAIAAAGGRAVAVECDVRDEAQVQHLVRAATDAHGPVEVLCSNAGVAIGGGPDVDDVAWARAWETNVLAHVYGVRAVLPGMLDRGEGYLVHTASAAGLLTQIGDLPYSVTKHAVVGLAEWLAITYGDAGVRVSCICPQYVRTGMTTGGATAASHGVVSDARMRSVGAVLEPDAVADAVLDAMRDERFLVLPHPEVLEYFGRKASDYDRWLGGMRRLQARWEGE